MDNSALYRSQGNTRFCANIFLRYLRLVSDCLHNCIVVNIRLVFSIGAIGINFGVNGVNGVTLFGLNDTILINSRLFPIRVDAEIAVHVDQFRLSKAIFLSKQTDARIPRNLCSL